MNSWICESTTLDFLRYLRTWQVESYLNFYGNPATTMHPGQCDYLGLAEGGGWVGEVSYWRQWEGDGECLVFYGNPGIRVSEYI